MPLELDLTEVSHLGSVGIQALHELAEDMTGTDRTLLLIAPPGHPARYPLELTGLGHLLDNTLVAASP